PPLSLHAALPISPLNLNSLRLGAAAAGLRSWVGDGNVVPILVTEIAAYDAGWPDLNFHDYGFIQQDAATTLANLLQVEEVPVIVLIPSRTSSGADHYVLVT